MATEQQGIQPFWELSIRPSLGSKRNTAVNVSPGLTAVAVANIDYLFPIVLAELAAKFAGRRFGTWQPG